MNIITIQLISSLSPSLSLSLSQSQCQYVPLFAVILRLSQFHDIKQEKQVKPCGPSVVRKCTRWHGSLRCHGKPTQTNSKGCRNDLETFELALFWRANRRRWKAQTVTVCVWLRLKWGEVMVDGGGGGGCLALKPTATIKRHEELVGWSLRRRLICFAEGARDATVKYDVKLGFQAKP